MGENVLHILDSDLAPPKTVTKVTDDILDIKSNNDSISVPKNF